MKGADLRKELLKRNAEVMLGDGHTNDFETSQEKLSKEALFTIREYKQEDNSFNDEREERPSKDEDFEITCEDQQESVSDTENETSSTDNYEPILQIETEDIKEGNRIISHRHHDGSNHEDEAADTHSCLEHTNRITELEEQLGFNLRMRKWAEDGWINDQAYMKKLQLEIQALDDQGHHPNARDYLQTLTKLVNKLARVKTESKAREDRDNQMIVELQEEHAKVTKYAEDGLQMHAELSEEFTEFQRLKFEKEMEDDHTIRNLRDEIEKLRNTQRDNTYMAIKLPQTLSDQAAQSVSRTASPIPSVEHAAEQQIDNPRDAAPPSVDIRRELQRWISELQPNSTLSDESMSDQKNLIESLNNTIIGHPITDITFTMVKLMASNLQVSKDLEISEAIRTRFEKRAKKTLEREKTLKDEIEQLKGKLSNFNIPIDARLQSALQRTCDLEIELKEQRGHGKKGKEMVESLHSTVIKAVQSHRNPKREATSVEHGRERFFAELEAQVAELHTSLSRANRDVALHKSQLEMARKEQDKTLESANREAARHKAQQKAAEEREEERKKSVNRLTTSYQTQLQAAKEAEIEMVNQLKETVDLRSQIDKLQENLNSVELERELLYAQLEELSEKETATVTAAEIRAETVETKLIAKETELTNEKEAIKLKEAELLQRIKIVTTGWAEANHRINGYQRQVDTLNQRSEMLNTKLEAFQERELRRAENVSAAATQTDIPSSHTQVDVSTQAGGDNLEQRFRSNQKMIVDLGEGLRRTQKDLLHSQNETWQARRTRVNKELRERRIREETEHKVRDRLSRADRAAERARKKAMLEGKDVDWEDDDMEDVEDEIVVDGDYEPGQEMDEASDEDLPRAGEAQKEIEDIQKEIEDIRSDGGECDETAKLLHGEEAQERKKARRKREFNGDYRPGKESNGGFDEENQDWPAAKKIKL